MEIKIYITKNKKVPVSINNIQKDNIFLFNNELLNKTEIALSLKNNVFINIDINK